MKVSLKNGGTSDLSPNPTRNAEGVISRSWNKKWIYLDREEAE